MSYKIKEAKALHDAEKTYDMLPIINPYSPKQMDILDTWREHLKQQDIPFLVIEGTRMCQDYVRRDNIKLWKERYV
jgi:hypothetical protein